MSENNGRVDHGTSAKRPAFDDAIPKRGPEIFIKRLKAGEEIVFTAWGTKIRGMWVHWNGQTEKSEPHFESECRGCKEGATKRWKGFLHGYSSSDRQEMFLELTPTSASALMQQISGPENLRGACFRVARSKAHNGRLRIHMLAPLTDTRALPKEKDPRRSILKLWGIPEHVADAWLGELPGEGPEPEDSGDECL